MTFVQLLAGAAAFLALEGLLYAAFPTAMRRAIANVALMPSERVRLLGLGIAVLGVAVATVLTR